MKINSIINRYLFAEMIGPFVINLVFFTFIFLMAEMLKITDLIVNYNIGLFTILKLLIFSTPYFLTFVIPMSIMIAILLTFLRLSNDNEIIALKSAGISIYRLLPPVLTFCFIGFIFTIFMSLYGMRWSGMAIKEITFKIISSNIDIGLKERTFNDNFKNIMLYVNKIDVKTKELIDVFIEDKMSKEVISTIVAPKGKLLSNPERYIYNLRLYNGLINNVDLKTRSTYTTMFKMYDLSLDLKKIAVSVATRKHRKEMSIGELRRYLKNVKKKDWKYYKALMEVHKKFSIPFACFALGLLAVPLGIHSKSAKQSSGLVIGLLFFLIYYLMLSAGMVFGETGAYPPFIGMWMPNLVMLSVGIYLLIKTANERYIRIDLFISCIKKSIERLYTSYILNRRSNKKH